MQKSNQFDFYYDNGYEIISLEFGANVLHYFSVDCVGEKDLNYVFLASGNPDKWARYEDFLTPVFSMFTGFIDGPGWSEIDKSIVTNFPKTIERYIYSRAKVGVNLHIQFQIDNSCELNERTYILAACGVQQLMDSPKLLLDRFDSESVFLANSPSEYLDLMKYIISNPTIAEEKAIRAMRKVYGSYTSFHRIDSFINNVLKSCVGIK